MAQYPWIVSVIKYAEQYLLRKKISLGIPLYYWSWDNTTGKLTDIGGRAGIAALEKTTPVTLGYSATEQAAYMTFKKNGDSYTLWYENAKSIAAKMALVKSYGLEGFSAWALGLENADVYQAMAK